MNQKSVKLLLCFVSAVCLYACSGKTKISVSGANADQLKNYRTYAWIAPGDTALNGRRDDKIFAGLIESSANKEIQGKGMKVDNQNPDVVFMFDTKIEEKAAYRSTPSNTEGSFGFGGYAYGYNGGAYYSGAYNPMEGLETTHITVEEGNLTYSMFDRKTGKLLWKGSAIKNLDAKTDRADIEKTIKKATRFIFAKLPIKVK